jgi:hypothetical protein
VTRDNRIRNETDVASYIIRGLVSRYQRLYSHTEIGNEEWPKIIYTVKYHQEDESIM